MSLSHDFWKDAGKARKINQEKSYLEKELKQWEELEELSNDISLLFELAEEEEEGELLCSDIDKELKRLREMLSHIEIEKMLSGDKDMNNAIVSLHPGAGGTESQDWAQMLMRMYIKWCERNRYKTEIIDILPGDEAGIKSVTFSVSGKYSYGYLKAEAGVHRLVRISPYDANKRRHTSFASLFVYPEIEDGIDLAIDEKDLRIDTYRASSAGGQHVNKTSSAVRITHIPTGIVAQCQNERSQHKNKAVAMKVLRARLYKLEKEKKERELNDFVGEKKDIAWGSQIRSYIFQPYRLVKDHRTNIEVGNVDSVMDGDIDQFIETYLLQSIKSQKD